MSVVLLVLTDGRDELLAQTIASAERSLYGGITRQVIHTDNGEKHRARVARIYPGWEVIGGERLGFGGAINRAWGHVCWNGEEEFVFHVEDDFTFNRAVHLDLMGQVMRTRPYIAQMALRRQPWNAAEELAGGIVESWPEEYTDRTNGDDSWLEHRLCVTTNPALWRMERVCAGWPNVEHSEQVYSAGVFSDPDAVSAFWGSRDSGEAVTHIGTQRAGVGY